MTKTTLSEETQELLDEVYDVELAHEFIENHGEDYFLTYYEKYEELVREYDQNLIDEFAKIDCWQEYSYVFTKYMTNYKWEGYAISHKMDENYEEIVSVNVRNVEIPEPETV